MPKYTNSEIASDEDLWNEYFNVSAFDESKFDSLTFEERLTLLDEAFPDYE